MSVGKRIKESRESAGLTQEELGKQIGVTGVAIMRYEKEQRQPRLEQFKAIASTLGVDVNWLMNGFTLEQRDQALKDSVKQRYDEAKKWLDHKEKIGALLIKLNDDGQQKAVERVEELTEIPKYQREKPQDAPNAPSEGKHTTPPENPSEGPQEGK